MTELTPQEKHARNEVSWDMDLMNRARDEYGMSTSPEADVLDQIHASYPGGIYQYWRIEGF